MTKDKQNQAQGHLSTSILAVATIIVTFVAAIPSFLSLNTREGNIYYSTSVSKLHVPTVENEGKLWKLLKENGIPSRTLSISIINQGNAQSDNIRIQVQGNALIMNVWWEPGLEPTLVITSPEFGIYPASEKDPNVIWVDKPAIQINEKSAIIEVKRLAATKAIKIHVGFESDYSGPTSIDIFQNGTPAKKVLEAADVPQWSKYSVFVLPIKILVMGIIVVIAWAFGLALMTRQELREYVKRFLSYSFSATLSELKFFPLSVVFWAITEMSKQKPTGPEEKHKTDPD